MSLNSITASINTMLYSLLLAEMFRDVVTKPSTAALANTQ